MRRGMGTGTAIFLVVLFGVVIYLLWNFGRVWFDKKWMTGKVRDTIETRFFEQNQTIIDDIMTYGKERNLVILPERVLIDRPQKDSMRITVEYDDEVKTPAFTKHYIIHIQVTETTGGG